MSDQLQQALFHYIQQKELSTHNNKQKASAEEKKQMEEEEKQIILLMEQCGTTVRQVGNKFVSIEEDTKKAKPGKELDIECFTTFLITIIKIQMKKHGVSAQHVKGQMQELFNMPVEQVPMKYFDFKEEYKVRQGTVIKKLKISDKRPYQAIVGSLMEL